MTYEITTTAGTINIIHGLDNHTFVPSNLLVVSKIGNFIVLSSDEYRGYRIDFTCQVVLNGVLQTTIAGFLAAMVAMAKPLTYITTFANAVLVANVLTVNHNLNANTASTHIFDGSGVEVTGQYTPTKITVNQLTVDFGEAIVGTWTIVIRKEN